MKISPLHDRVIVEHLEEECKTASGIGDPGYRAAGKPDQGEIMAVGKVRILKDGKVRPLGVGESHRVQFQYKESASVN